MERKRKRQRTAGDSLPFFAVFIVSVTQYSAFINADLPPRIS